MTESVMFLTCPSTGFDIIETSHISSPFSFGTDFDEFGVLHHHCMYNSKERFIRWENSSSTSHCIT